MDYSHVAESIWAYANGNWYHDGAAGVPYVRKDLHEAEISRLTAALAEAEARSAALVAGAYEAAAMEANALGDGHDGEELAWAMRELTPADATEALARLTAEAKAEGMREAAGIAMFNHRQDYPWACEDFADGYEVAQADICSAILAAAAAKEAGE